MNQTKMVAHSGFDERASGRNQNRWLKAGFSRRTTGIAYRCCLPTLAEFTARRRTRPTYQRSVFRAAPQAWAEARDSALLSGLQIQGTAISPLSATKL